MPGYFAGSAPPKPAQSDKVLFNEPAKNEGRKDTASHVYDDFKNPKAAKMRGGFPRKKTLDELKALHDRKEGKTDEKPPIVGEASAEKRLDGIEAESTKATR